MFIKIQQQEICLNECWVTHGCKRNSLESGTILLRQSYNPKLSKSNMIKTSPIKERVLRSLIVSRSRPRPL